MTFPGNDARRRKKAATVLAAALAIAAAAGAAMLLRPGVAALHADLATAGSPSATVLHLLVTALGGTLAWSAVVLAASTATLARLSSSQVVITGNGGRRPLNHRIAGLMLTITGIAALGSGGTATAAPLPPPVVQQVPAPVLPAGAMALPLPAAPAAPTGAVPREIPQPGWVTPAPSPITQRCRTGARLIAGPVTRSEPTEVVVHRGDSLWTLVSRHLRTNDACVISAVWPQWYAANRAVIGDDPDLLLVGQRLRIPAMPDDNQGER